MSPTPRRFRCPYCATFFVWGTVNIRRHLRDCVDYRFGKR